MASGTELRLCRVAATPHPAYKFRNINKLRRPDKRSAIRLFPAKRKSGVLFQPVQYHVVVIAGFEVIEHVLNFAFGINQEADAVDAIVGFAHK